MAASLLAAILLLLLLFFTSPSLWSVVARSAPYRHPVCYPLQPFCLFAPLHDAGVGSVQDAIEACNNASRRSWPFSPSDARSLQLLDEYVDSDEQLQDASIVMNVARRETGWTRIDDAERLVPLEADVVAMLKESDQTLVFQKDVARDAVKPYRVICMMECLSEITEYEEKTYADGVKLPNVTKQECMMECERFDCVGWTWAEDLLGEACSVHNRSDEALVTATGALYKHMNRSGKTVEKCIIRIVDEDYEPAFVGLIDDLDEARRPVVGGDAAPESAPLIRKNDSVQENYVEETPAAGADGILVTGVTKKRRPPLRPRRSTRPIRAGVNVPFLIPAILLLFAASIIGVWYYLQIKKEKLGSKKPSKVSSAT